MSGDEIKLIEVVQRHNVLYDMTASEYKDHAVRDVAWESVAAEMQLNKDECKERWSKLRNCFTNALKRRRFMRGRTGRQMPPWKYERIMSFLLPYMQGKATSGDLYMDAIQPSSPPRMDDNEGQFIVYEDDVEIDLKMTTPTVEMASDSSLPPFTIAQSPSPVGSDHLHNGSLASDDRLANAIRRMRSKTNSKNGEYQSPDLDETDHFFLSMSKALKRLSAINQARIKMDLHRAIFEAEIHQLENPGRNDFSTNCSSNNVKKERE